MPAKILLFALASMLAVLRARSDRVVGAQPSVLVSYNGSAPGAILDFSPDFKNPIQNVTAAVGREAVLTCTVNDLGQYKVGWMRSDDQTILSLHTRVITHNPRISVTHDDNFRTWQLRIRQLRESDAGCYMCQINTSSMKKQVGCVDVQVPPDIDDTETSSDVTVSEGENVTLTCKATGHPSPRILWRREDGNQLVLHIRPHETDRADTFGGSQIALYRIDRKQMGAYLCIANNDVPPAVSKRIVLNVNFAPVVNIPNQLVGTPLNTEVQVECHVEAFPNTIHYWTKNKEILMNGKKHTLVETRHGYRIYMTLIIHNVLRRDIGTYTCVATNSLGRANGTIRIYEIKVQTKPPPTTTTTTTTAVPVTSPPMTIITSPATVALPPRRATTSATISTIENQLINNYLPSVEPAPLETMPAASSSSGAGAPTSSSFCSALCFFALGGTTLLLHHRQARRVVVNR